MREVMAALALGWHLLRLRGKRPLETGWPNLPPLTETEALAWAARNNLGVNCGASGLFVVDPDLSKGATWDREIDTACVRTGGGGLHLFYKMPDPPLGNSQGRLGPAIDTRGVGGQVVLAGSTHPSGNVYRWEFRPEQIGIAELPGDLLAKLRVSRIEEPREPLDVTNADQLLNATLRRLVNAREGSRGSETNRAAYIAGGLIAAGIVPEAEAIALLVAATKENRLFAKDGETEVLAIIGYGLRAGKMLPFRVAS